MMTLFVFLIDEEIHLVYLLVTGLLIMVVVNGGVAGDGGGDGHWRWRSWWSLDMAAVVVVLLHKENDGVAVVNAHTDQGHKLKSGIKTLQQGKKAFTSSVYGANPADLRPVSGFLGSDVGGLIGGEERRTQSDDSLRQVMYMNYWGPS